MVILPLNGDICGLRSLDKTHVGLVLLLISLVTVGNCWRSRSQWQNKFIMAHLFKSTLLKARTRLSSDRRQDGRHIAICVHANTQVRDELELCFNKGSYSLTSQKGKQKRLPTFFVHHIQQITLEYSTGSVSELSEIIQGFKKRNMSQKLLRKQATA